MGFIIRNCSDFRNVVALKALFFAFVRSKIEYASVVWAPYYAYQRDAIERVQKKFLKYLLFKEQGRYPPRGMNIMVLLQKYDVQLLEDRRRLAAVKFIVNIVQGKADVPAILSKLSFAVPRLNSRQHITFRISTFRTNLGVNSPINVMTKLINGVSNVCDVNYDGIKKILKHVLMK